MNPLSKYYIYLSKKPKQTHRVKYIVPLNKTQKLDAFIKNTDTIYKSDLDNLNINRPKNTLRYCEKRLNIKIIPINSNSWEIVKPPHHK